MSPEAVAFLTYDLSTHSLLDINVIMQPTEYLRISGQRLGAQKGAQQFRPAGIDHPYKGS